MSDDLFFMFGSTDFESRSIQHKLEWMKLLEHESNGSVPHLPTFDQKSFSRFDYEKYGGNNSSQQEADHQQFFPHLSDLGQFQNIYQAIQKLQENRLGIESEIPKLMVSVFIK